MKRIVVTGAAGFIGFHTSLALLRRGDCVLGLDNFTDDYSVKLKQARIQQIKNTRLSRFQLQEFDLLDYDKLFSNIRAFEPHCVIHLAATAGTRNSFKNPMSYIQNNIQATLNILECARHYKKLSNLIIASSSSIYGKSDKIKFLENDKADEPLSLYASTKKSVELMAHAYHHQFSLPITLLRFFTVYGPWGRPDMMPVIFGRNILEGKLIQVFGDGSSKRDYTYIDDLTNGILSAVDTPQPYRIYNLGNDNPVEITAFISLLEKHIGKKAKIKYDKLHPLDMASTWANIDLARKELGFNPKTQLEDGIKSLVKWLKSYAFTDK
jgi:UDP-glucuronate 4-epimerase